MDKLSELEKIIFDLYIAKGYIRDKENNDWEFEIKINSKYKHKEILVFFYEKGEETLLIFSTLAKKTEQMYDTALNYFKKELAKKTDSFKNT